MKTILMALLVISSVTSLIATQKYNGFTGKWETVPDNWETKYNSFEGTWSYQPKDAHVEYNSFENKWEWNSGHNNNTKKPKSLY